MIRKFSAGSGEREVDAEMEVKPRFWRGPIASIGQAERIIGWAGWPFIVFSLGVISTLIGSIWTGDIPRSVTEVCLFALVFTPAFFLLRKRSTVAATVLFCVALLTSVLSIASMFFIVQGRDLGETVAFIPVMIFWLALTIQSWRAVRATLALPRLKTADAFD
jgi:hypothetical protein